MNPIFLPFAPTLSLSLSLFRNEMSKTAPLKNQQQTCRLAGQDHTVMTRSHRKHKIVKKYRWKPKKAVHQKERTSPKALTNQKKRAIVVPASTVVAKPLAAPLVLQERKRTKPSVNVVVEKAMGEVKQSTAESRMPSEPSEPSTGSCPSTKKRRLHLKKVRHSRGQTYALR